MSFFRDNLIAGITKNEYEFFMTKANVVGVGVGNKIIRGIDTGEKCVSVFVKEKVSIDKLSKEDLIPEIYSCAKTDVVETGEFKLMADKSRVRPIKGGYSVSPVTVNAAGTIGGILYDNITNKPYILSNNHVLADVNKTPIGTNIVQPGIADGGSASNDIIGTLSKVVLLNFDDSFPNPHFNYADAAIAEINADIKVDNSSMGLIGKATGIATNVDVGQTIKKYGRTTGYTTAKITAVHAVTAFTLEGRGVAIFYDQIMANQLVEAGDSGSLVLDQKNKIIGMVYAGTKGGTLITPIKLVLDYFNAHFIFN